MSFSPRRLLSVIALVSLAVLVPGFSLAESAPETGAVETTETGTHSDNTQPIRIAADSAEQDEREGVTVYSGNVVIEQSSLQIEADQVTIRTATDNPDKARKVEVIVATGKPAHLRQQTPTGDHGEQMENSEAIDASADTIHYWLVRGVIKLEKNATINQHGSSVSGDEIEYFIDRQRVKAKADPSRPKGRVQTIIAPETLRQNETDSGSDNGDS